MHILCIGISHRTASVELRERVAFDAQQAADLLAALSERHPHAELALISTCNRTEFYVARPLHGHPRAEELIETMASARGIAAEALSDAAYHVDNERAIRHLMQVAAGLDSMVLGEPQILGQVKTAYEQAQQADTVGPVLHKLFQSALATAKKARTETGIDAGRTSVASVAVDFARHLFHDLADKTVLVLGAGKMTELTLEHFMARSPKRLIVCNRNVERAEPIARRYGGEAAPLDGLDEQLTEADVLISSTGADEPIVTAERFRPLVKRRRFRPLLAIDIAVPRDFEPAVGELTNVYLYNLDDLQQVVADQLAQRSGEVEACRELIERAVAECYEQVQSEDFGELIRRLRSQLHQIGRAENRRTFNKLRDADPEDVEKILDEHTHRLVNKILHRPISELGRGKHTHAAQAAMYATALRRLFDLDEEPEDLDPPEPTEAPSRAGRNARQGTEGTGTKGTSRV